MGHLCEQDSSTAVASLSTGGCWSVTCEGVLRPSVQEGGIWTVKKGGGVLCRPCGCEMKPIVGISGPPFWGSSLGLPFMGQGQGTGAHGSVVVPAPCRSSPQACDLSLRCFEACRVRCQSAERWQSLLMC